MNLKKFESNKHKIFKDFDLIFNEINKIYNKKDTSRYFEGILLLASSLESLMKLLIDSKIIIENANLELPKKKFEELRARYQQSTSSLDNIARVSFLANYISDKCYVSIMDFKSNRNKFIHNFTENRDKINFRQLFKYSTIIYNEIIPKIYEDYLTLMGEE